MSHASRPCNSTKRHLIQGETTTTVTTMKMEYGDEMKLDLLDSLGISLMTLRCIFTPT
jgi:hypothetical protein